MYVSRFQPGRGRTMKSPQPGISYSVSDVWAAAVAAQRINGEYLKTGYTECDKDGAVLRVWKRNRDVMMEFLENPERLLVDDVIQGEQVRDALAKDITWRALKGGLNDFDQSVSRVLAVQDRFDTQLHRLELAVVACLPASHARMLAKQDVEARMSHTSGEYLAPVGNKVEATVQVIRCNFSSNWNTNYITAVTEHNEAVLFSFREAQDPGTWLTIHGTVRAHRDGVTQLNRVKVR